MEQKDRKTLIDQIVQVKKSLVDFADGSGTKVYAGTDFAAADIKQTLLMHVEQLATLADVL